MRRVVGGSAALETPAASVCLLPADWQDGNWTCLPYLHRDCCAWGSCWRRATVLTWQAHAYELWALQRMPQGMSGVIWYSEPMSAVAQTRSARSAGAGWGWGDTGRCHFPPAEMTLPALNSFFCLPKSFWPFKRCVRQLYCFPRHQRELGGAARRVALPACLKSGGGAGWVSGEARLLLAVALAGCAPVCGPLPRTICCEALL